MFALRVTQVAEGNPRGAYILYHARAARRARNNRALDFAKTLGKRVIMAEWLDEPHLSPRIEAFLREASERTAREADVEYHFEPDRSILENARFVVTDELPTLPTPPHATHLFDGTYEQLERVGTHDDVWNLARRQLLETGVIHNYLRMLWGKKIIEWSETPEEAHAAMVRLHDVHALDGRDPNTHAGILWCFGKHDRPWAPERPIFGSIRWMSSEQTRKKMRLRH